MSVTVARNAAPTQDLDLDAGLRRLGYESFRPGQREAIETLLERGRLLLVAPTGGGKSLIYQLPACLLPGTTLVLSPLVALMHDQVQAMEARGVSATFLASTLDAQEVRRRMARIAAGQFRLVYAAPERLVFAGFRGLLRDIDVALLAVDEAHCISEWGHDFRPEYLQIGELVAELPQVRVLACTATATPVVRDEILSRLGLGPDTPQMVRGFARPNLALRSADVAGRSEREERVDALLAEALGAPGAGRGVAIVYAPTRRTAEEEAARLQGRRWRVAAYHAGMDGAPRERTQRAFRDGALEIVVATNAFGMGIDRPDVRAVVHLAPPGSIEAYYQEVGRAGRDGAPAWGLMLVAPGDLPLRRRLLEGGGEASAAVVAHKWGLFLELMRWAEGGSCRHDAILRYFGDEAETLDGCGRCDVCCALAPGEGDRPDPEVVTLIVRKALSAVARVHSRFGMEAAVRLLHGTDDPRLARAGFDRTPTFGSLRGFAEDWIRNLLRRCVTAGWADFTAGDRPVLLLSESGKAVMKAERPARLLLPPMQPPKPHPAPAHKPGRPPKRSPEDALDPTAAAVFEALRRHRLGLARDQGVAPFVIASDRTLRELALLRPANRTELLAVYGIGQAKSDRYGEGFLQVIGGAIAREGSVL
jgi:ATP-dependent DNA helicase RecQ